MKRKFVLLTILLMTIGWGAQAQSVGVKTNLAYLSTMTPNLGFEFRLANRWTLDLSGGYNPFDLNKETGKKWKHWSALPEIRYYLCEAFNGHFFGLHGQVGFLNASNLNIPFNPFKGLKDYRYQGWMYGGGLTYGYEFLLGKHWNLEASVSAGYLMFDYTKYNCGHCGTELGSGKKNYFGPTKATLSLIYLF